MLGWSPVRWLAFLAALVCLIPGATGVSLAQERITDFRSDIEVLDNGSVAVTETISVIAAGNQIKRGIYREFPTVYRDRFGNEVIIDFEVVDVMRDGRAEPYHIRPGGTGQRVYLGDKDVFLEPGPYTYTISYIADRQVGFFDDFDEIYWNVTGNNWAFPIEKATAVIELPPGAPVVAKAAYTGRLGATGQDFVYDLDGDGDPRFTTTQRLAPGEGLTIAIAWPKGFVTEPSTADKVGFMLRDNAGLAAAIVGFVVLLAYYAIVWSRVGRDPRAGTIVPLFSPPHGFSPAAARYVMEMGYDDRAFTAAIINMAVKGHLEIHEEEDGKFRLEKVGDEEKALTAGERALAGKLFGRSREIVLENKNHKRIKGARSRLEAYLEAEYQKGFFVRNRGYLVPGLLITILVTIAIVVTARDPLGAGFMTVWLSVWTFAVFMIIRHARRSFQKSVGEAVIFVIVAVIFVGGEVFALGGLAESASLPTALSIAVLAAVNAIFYLLLKAPTRLGREIMDAIDGFKLYLSVAEKDRFETLNPPDRTPELYERYLPYALALGVEQAWSEKFSDVLARAMKEDDYRPRWYSGRSTRGFNPSTVADSLGGSFATAVAASASPPGSNSGSGGGGSSGGGGGGGGGGGW